MIIRNFPSLSTNSAKKDTLSILEAGIAASNPMRYLSKIVKNNRLIMSDRIIDLDKYDHVFVIATGKASYEMARAVDSLTRVDGGMLVVPRKVGNVGKKFQVIRAGHPIPDKNSVTAAKKILHFLSMTASTDLVIFLISGGSSSLVTMPDGITLEEKQATTDLLLNCGASIHEINCVRKHLSAIKGGLLLRHLKSDAVSLVMSDVTGDDLSSIASGMTYYDKTSFSDAKQILTKYHLRKIVPTSVLKHIELGVRGKIPESPKRSKIKNYVIATNRNCLDEMKLRAQDLGYAVKVMSCVSGDVRNLGSQLSKAFSGKAMSCVIFGGESTVAVKGDGKGGRNQELVLHTAINLSENGKSAIVSSIGTDGIDGNTGCAGAIWQSDQKTNDLWMYLDNNDTYNFFKKYGGLIFTGHTGTNLMDIGVILRRQ